MKGQYIHRKKPDVYKKWKTRKRKKTKVSDLQKLDNIGKRNGNIKAFTISSNMISANTGKDNWGKIEIAIDNESVFNLFDNRLVGVLYLTTMEEWKKEQT